MILKADLPGYKQAAANSVTVAFARDLERAVTILNAACPAVESPSARRGRWTGGLPRPLTRWDQHAPSRQSQ